MFKVCLARLSGVPKSLQIKMGEEDGQARESLLENGEKEMKQAWRQLGSMSEYIEHMKCVLFPPCCSPVN